MKEDDICELLKFERKMLRARIDTLKNDKFIQTKMKMETGPDGKAQRQNYYYINYKVRDTSQDISHNCIRQAVFHTEA